MKGLTKKRLSEVREAKRQLGVDGAAEKLGLSRETVRRYCRKAKAVEEEMDTPDGIVTEDALLRKIREQYSDKELRLLAQGSIPMEYKHTPVHNFKGEKIKVGYWTDTHIGSVYTNYDYIAEAIREFKRERVDMVVHAGDVSEGMSNRPGHIYECTELGFERQLDKGIELLKPLDFCPHYLIDGNHDRWYIKSNGAVIVKHICDAIPNAQFLGHDEGDIRLNKKTTIKLWHGEDGSSYAISYRLQKLIESLTGGEKPNLIVAGHVHKYGKFFIRNVHCIGAGCIQNQSKWMRGKRLNAHVGFGILELTLNDSGIGKVTDTFYPFYT